MKIAGLLGRTLRAVPSGVSPVLGLASRAGFLRPSADGWIVLPLGVRVVNRIVDALIAGLECERGHLLVDGEADRAQTYAGLLQSEVQSHRHLPLRIATEWSGSGALDGEASRSFARPYLEIVGAFAEQRSLAGFVRQADAGLEGLANAAGIRLTCGAGVGDSRTWLALGDAGRSAALTCTACGSTYARDSAPFARDELAPSPARERARVSTPGASTIQALADMLGVGRERTLKALLLTTERGELVFAVVRGDLDVSLEKLGVAVGAKQLRPATEAQITAAGAVPGFASPIGLRVQTAGEREGIRVLADPSVFSGEDFAAGANEPDYHFKHVDPRRDFAITQEVDIALPPPGARCATCGSALIEHHGSIIARWMPLCAPSFAGESGGEEQGAAAWATIDLLAIFEQVVAGCADDSGIAWPAYLAPADVHVVDLRATEPAVLVADALEARGLCVLLDDRPLAAGAKFTDADLIGCPLRVTISPRSLQAGGAELSGRKGTDPLVFPVDQIPDASHARLAALMST